MIGARTPASAAASAGASSAVSGSGPTRASAADAENGRRRLDPAEAARVGEAQLVAARQPERDVGVGRARRVRGLDAQPPGHAEVDHDAGVGASRRRRPG